MRWACYNKLVISYISERVMVMSNQQDLRSQIIEKAWTDAEFKKQLLADPKAAIKEAFGLDVPSGISVEVLEETDEKYYLVLPKGPSDSKANELAAARWY